MTQTNIAEPLSWREEDRIVYFEVRSRGTTPAEWRKKFSLKNDYEMDDGAERVPDSKSFRVTNGISYRIAVLRSWHFAHPNGLRTKDILAEGKRRGFKRLALEAAFLMREDLSDLVIQDMHFNWIVAMHNSVKINGDPALLRIPADNMGRRVLGAVFLGDMHWQRFLGGWAFLVPS